MAQITKSIWIETPNIQQQAFPSISQNKSCEQFLNNKLGNPHLLCWIKNEILEYLNSGKAKYRQPIIGVSVFITDDVVQYLKRYLLVREDENIFGNIGLWLTEQISSEKYRLKARWPYISCTVKVLKKKSGLEIEEFHNSRKLQTRLIHWLDKEFFAKDGVDNIHPFYLKFQDPWLGGSTDYYLKQVLPDAVLFSVNKKIVFNLDRSDTFGANALINICDNLNQILPFLAENHIEIAATVNPNMGDSNQDVQLWIQHKGHHETWVFSNDWKQIPKGAWTPVNEGSYIVLGRVVFSKLDQQKVNILRGSMILKVECQDLDETFEDGEIYSL